MPVVLTREEIRAVLGRLSGVPRLMALLLYGAGLRLLECARLRVKDIDFTSNHIVVRPGKGNRDRVAMLPAAVKDDLAWPLKSIYTHVLNLGPGAGAPSGLRPRPTAG